jgi:hypothetical protein
MYFCVVLCIACFGTFFVLFVRTEKLPPGGYPIAVKYIISNVQVSNTDLKQVIHSNHWAF